MNNFEEYNKKIKELAKELNITSPIKMVQFIPIELLYANEYNPNTVAPPEMKLLKLSILEDGYTQPIVVFDDKEGGYCIVDGFHRWRTLKENKEIQEMMCGYAPVVIIDKPIENRMASTIRHNRARGKHGIDEMSSIVSDLKKRGWDDKKISKELGMDTDEVLRLKQITGLADLFADKEFNKGWEVK